LVGIVETCLHFVIAFGVVGVLIFWYDERRMKQRYYEQKVKESLEEE